ncbi:MAG TPA: hypothetical protein VHS59_06570 [Bacillota bacterium]|nr:hypothetical protein [Bacillota bacterium]
MRGETAELLPKAELLFERLNGLLEKYYQATQEIGRFLREPDEETFQPAEELLNKRQSLIADYEVLKQEYQQLLTHIPPADTTKFAELQRVRDELIASIARADEENSQLLNVQFADQKTKLKQVREGKALLNAYFGVPIQNDGIFIDKRE